MADGRRYTHPTVSAIGVPTEDQPKLRRTLIRWLALGIVAVAVFLASIGVLGGWASSASNWPAHGAGEETLGFIVGCLALLSIPTILYLVRAVAELLRVSKFDDESLEQRIANLQGMLSDATDLMTELREEISDRSKVMQALMKQAAEYENLAKLNHEEAEAVSRLVDRTIAKAGRKSNRIGYLLFCLGLLASIPIGILTIWVASIIHH